MTFFLMHQPAKNGQNRPKKSRPKSAACTAAGVHSVHTPTILQFGDFWGGYRTAVPLAH
jgi:hypothetical protein